MHIALVIESQIPVFAYGGTERVAWDLGKGLAEMGHQVTFLAGHGSSSCSFAKVIHIDKTRPVHEQVPKTVDLIHFHSILSDECETPHLVTQHAHADLNAKLPLNTVFVSQNHAFRHGSDQFVHNGLDWSSYRSPSFKQKTAKRYHFLGKASWRVKNVKGAINIALRAGVELDVLGGTRFNLKRGIRLTFSPRIHFHGMVGGSQKFDLLNQSNGLIFPVRWNEPFGLAVIESMYFGCPVFATPYGALPEIVTPDCGLLSHSVSALVNGIQNASYTPQASHERARDCFNHLRMTSDYLTKYQFILGGQPLHHVNPQLTEHPKQMNLID